MRIKYKSLLLNPGHGEAAPLYWGLFTAIVTIVTGPDFLQGNTIQWNWRRKVSEQNISVSFQLLDPLSCRCSKEKGMSPLLLITHWSNRVGIWKQKMERNQTTISSVTFIPSGLRKAKRLTQEKSLEREGYCCVCESSAFNYPLIKQGWHLKTQKHKHTFEDTQWRKVKVLLCVQVLCF